MGRTPVGPVQRGSPGPAQGQAPWWDPHLRQSQVLSVPTALGRHCQGCPGLGIMTDLSPGTPPQGSPLSCLLYWHSAKPSFDKFCRKKIHCFKLDNQTTLTAGKQAWRGQGRGNTAHSHLATVRSSRVGPHTLTPIHSAHLRTPHRLPPEVHAFPGRREGGAPFL